MERGQYFPIHYWAEPCHVCNHFTETTFVCHSPRLSFTSLYSPFRVHPIRGDGHRALCVEQHRVTLPSVSIPTTSPCPREPTSASASTDTLDPPQSHQKLIHRDQRIFGGDLGPDRCPSTQRVVYSLLQSNHIRHTTTLPIHQSKTNAEGTRSDKPGGPSCTRSQLVVTYTEYTLNILNANDG
jgi:hypothetical protein